MTHYAKLVFSHPVRSAGHVVHSSAYGMQNFDVLIFMLELGRYRFDKNRLRTQYAELVFLHPVGSVSHIVHSGPSSAAKR
jgi:hypothetical protein